MHEGSCQINTHNRWYSLNSGLLPVYIVAKFVVTGKRHKTTATHTEREKDLTGCISPNLEKNKKDIGLYTLVYVKMGERLRTTHSKCLLESQVLYFDSNHYTDVIMITMASQITSLTVVYSTVYSDANQRIHQSSASLVFVWEIHRDR